MKKYLKIVDQNQAELWKRFVHFIVDRIVVYALFYAFGVFCSLTYELFGTLFFIEIAQEMGTVSNITDILITSSVYFIYILSMEYFTKGRTVGKYITGCKVISIDGTNPTFQEYFIRNISRFVPFDALSFLGSGNGWHDNWSDTKVIKIKNYEAERQTKSEIDNIGMKETA